MASPTKLMECMSQTLGITLAACDSTWKELRSRNLVINSGRGKRGTKVSARDCAVFLLALCGADHVKDSAEAAELYGGCIILSEGEHQDESYRDFAPISNLGPRHNLLAAVTAIIKAYETGNVPHVETSMVLPDGRSTRSQQEASVFLTLTSPPPSHPARIGMNHEVVAEYYRKRFSAEMFGEITEGTKRRIVERGDLQIEKRVSTATFRALGLLLREPKET